MQLQLFHLNVFVPPMFINRVRYYVWEYWNANMFQPHNPNGFRSSSMRTKRTK